MSNESEAVEIIRLSETPRVSVVIPSFSKSREDNLQALIEDLKGQTVKDLEILVVRGVSPQGKAINQGVRKIRGEILAVVDDDSRIGHSKVLENLVRALEKDSRVAMAGASILPPPNATPFQKKAAEQFPRFRMPIVEKVTDSDLPCHGCVVFRKEIFLKVGMEREDILRGLDPDLRVRIRQAGYRVVLVPDTWAYHPLPDGVLKFVRVFLRNGYGSAYAQVFRPDISYDTDENVSSGGFVPMTPFFFRLLRFPLRLVKSFLSGQWIRFLGYSVYAFGYLAGYLRFAFWERMRGKV